MHHPCYYLYGWTKKKHTKNGHIHKHFIQNGVGWRGSKPKREMNRKKEIRVKWEKKEIPVKGKTGKE